MLPAASGKVIVRIVPDCSKGKAYDGLILNGYDHYRVFHSENEFARGKCHVNGIENVQTLFAWSFAKFNGCDSDKFVIHLMEWEWRYNHRNEDLYKELTKILKRY